MQNYNIIEISFFVIHLHNYLYYLIYQEICDKFDKCVKKYAIYRLACNFAYEYVNYPKVNLVMFMRPQLNSVNCTYEV